VPDLLGPELEEVGLAPVLGGLGVVSRGIILLKDIMTSSSHSIHPPPSGPSILIGIDLSPLVKKWGDITLPSLLPPPALS
jgi:hypothetical protein